MSSLFLAQLLGIYFFIVGALVMARQTSVMPAIADLAANRALMLLIGFIELAAGIAIVLAYPQITWDWMGIIAVVGWMMLIEGLLYLALPSRKTQKFIKMFNKPIWYSAGGILSIVIGIYLAGVGFGMIPA